MNELHLANVRDRMPIESDAVHLDVSENRLIVHGVGDAMIDDTKRADPLIR